MKIALAQLNYHIGNLAYNYEKIANAIAQARKNEAEIIVFSELSVCGYPPMDMLEYSSFIEECNSYVGKIADLCTDIACVIGSPMVNTKAGKALFNSALFLYEGKILAQVNKSLLPDYDVFDEYRYFEANEQFSLLDFKGKKIAITICEDIWDSDYKLYHTKPVESLTALQPDIFINISASPFHANHATERKVVLQKVFDTVKKPIIYVNQVGANTELIFDGGSTFIDNNGQSQHLPSFSEAIQIVDTETTSKSDSSNTRGIKNIHDALILGIQDFFAKNKFKKAVIGLSGGIDSAVVLALAAKALGTENIHSLLMPSAFSSEHSVSDSVIMCEILKSSYDIVPIKSVFEAYENTLKPVFAGKVFDVAEENLQSRIRGTMLMAYSNKHGHILLNTSNKSELATGYGTLYGDMNGAISILGDLYKTQVYDLATYINRDEEIIPSSIIHKAPSAELRPDQQDSDSLPAYEILDGILQQYIEYKQSAKQITQQGFDENTVHKVVKLVHIAEFKRFQSPPILRVSAKAFGYSRKVPIVSVKP